MSNNSEDFLFVDEDSALQGFRKHAISFYQAEKKKILNHLPDRYRSSFGEIGFCYKRPVQILSPYQVPIGPLRRNWMSAFVTLMSEGKLEDLPYLLFWFDAPSSEPAACVTMEPRNEFLTHAEGMKRNLDAMPRHIQQKIILNERLTAADDLVMSALREFDIARRKPAEQRALPFAVVPDYELFAIAPAARAPTVRAMKKENNIADHSNSNHQVIKAELTVEPALARRVCNILPPEQEESDRSIFRKRKYRTEEAEIVEDHEERDAGNDPAIKVSRQEATAESSDEQQLGSSVPHESLARRDRGSDDEESSRKARSPQRKERLFGEKAPDEKNAEQADEENQKTPPARRDREGNEKKSARKSTPPQRNERPLGGKWSDGTNDEQADEAKERQKTMTRRQFRQMHYGCLRLTSETRRGSNGPFLKPARSVCKCFTWDYDRGVLKPIDSSGQRRAENAQALGAKSNGKDAKKDHDESEVPSTARKSQRSTTTPIKDKAEGGSYSALATKSEGRTTCQAPSDAENRADASNLSTPLPPSSSTDRAKEEESPIDEEQLRHVRKLWCDLVKEMPIDPLNASSVARCQAILQCLLKFPYEGAVRSLRILRSAKKLRDHPLLGALARQLVAKWKNELAGVLFAEWSEAISSQDLEAVENKLKVVLAYLRGRETVAEEVIRSHGLRRLVDKTALLFHEENVLLCQELLDLEDMVDAVLP